MRQQQRQDFSSQQGMKLSTLIAVFLYSISTNLSAQIPTILSEIMVNPTVGKDKGTWFEFYNSGDQPVNLGNRLLRLGNYNASRDDFGIAGMQVTQFKIPPGYVIPAKQYFVIGNNDDRATNGNVSVDRKYSSHVEMNETFGIVSIVGFYIVYWGLDGAPAAPFRPGAYLSWRNVTILPPVKNSIATYPAYSLGALDFCVSITSYSGAPDGAKGTPNATNVCPLPTLSPTKAPSLSPTKAPTKSPTKDPTNRPTKFPTKRPTKQPTKATTTAPTKGPAENNRSAHESVTPRIDSVWPNRIS
jgi:Lamin Tail Domain